MELRDLRAFLAVVRCGGFTAAAAELGYTQSAISQQVAALEAEVGHPLLHRRPVRPTPAGSRLAEHAARVLLRLEVARSELAQLDRTSRDLTVAISPLAAPRLLAAALRDLRAGGVRSQVTVRTIDPGSAVGQVASGGADIALVDGIAGPGEPLSLADAGLLTSTALVTSDLVVALPAGHPLAGHASLRLDVLADAPWIAAPGLYATGTGWPGSRRSAEGREDVPVVYEGSDVPTLLALVAAGHGAALLPAAACEGTAGIAAPRLADPPLVHRTEMLTLRGRADQHRPLLEALRRRGARPG